MVALFTSGPLKLSEPCHRKQQINSGMFQAEKAVHQLADVEVAFAIPFQDGVIPARHAYAFGDSTQQVPQPIGEPFDLFPHQALQGGILKHQPVEPGTRDGFDPSFIAFLLSNPHTPSFGRLMTVFRYQSFRFKFMRHVISEQWGVCPMAVPATGLTIHVESRGAS